MVGGLCGELDVVLLDQFVGVLVAEGSKGVVVDVVEEGRLVGLDRHPALLVDAAGLLRLGWAHQQPQYIITELDGEGRKEIAKRR